MAVSVDTVYQKVLSIANKEQRGYITPQEFNLLASQAQLEIFKSYFFQKNLRNRLEPEADHHTDEANIDILIDKKLAPFTSIQTITDANTFLTSVSGDVVYQTGSVFYNGRVARKVELNEIKRFLTSVRHAAGGDEPIYADSPTNGDDIVVYSPYALVGSGVTAEHFVIPSRPNWTYTVVNGQALYNASAADLVDFELHASEEGNLTFKILELAGIIINKTDLASMASAKSQEMDQQLKQ